MHYLDGRIRSTPIEISSGSSSESKRDEEWIKARIKELCDEARAGKNVNTKARRKKQGKKVDHPYVKLVNAAGSSRTKTPGECSKPKKRKEAVTQKMVGGSVCTGEVGDQCTERPVEIIVTPMVWRRLGRKRILYRAFQMRRIIREWRDNYERERSRSEETVEAAELPVDDPVVRQECKWTRLVNDAEAILKNVFQFPMGVIRKCFPEPQSSIELYDVDFDATYHCVLKKREDKAEMYICHGWYEFAEARALSQGDVLSLSI